MRRSRREARGQLRHPQHEAFRGVCRILGPLALIAGVVMFGIGIYDFTNSFGGHSKPGLLDFPGSPETSNEPDLFWLCFVGMFVLIGGVFLTKVGYLGAAARYVAGETAPVAADTIGYMADETKDSVKTIAGAVAEGIRGDGETETIVRCLKCNEENDGDAKFCKSCGEALQKSVPCPSCDELNDPDAKFCDNCGTGLGSR
ncbi:MAG: zinc ribbon domain-containing protein [Planctomycetota bacterium]|jgi:ribosomal protein L40E